MKKLSVLMASLMCLTVGGVYAAWTYSESEIAPAEADKGVQLQTYTDTKEAPGVYTLTPQVDNEDPVDKTNLFFFDSSLSQELDEADPHRVCFVTNCSLDITFTPNEHAPNDLRENGLDTTVSFVLGKALTDLTFAGKEVFTEAKLTTVVISEVGEDQDPTDGTMNWKKEEVDGQVVFKCTITEAQLDSVLGLTVNSALRLENSQEHKAFSELITGLTIKTKVEKKV